ncbi:site-2 protease family protein [Streptomyces sp. NPDC002130]|uniref:site-2 protease family protein n=1 Tax=Streptomyces sp. NPDC002130 TaxID=3155568 RepID=UPI00331880DD
MDESGGRGRPRSGNDESAERHAGRPGRATDPIPTDEQPTIQHRLTPEQPTPAPDQPAVAPTPTSAEPMPTTPSPEQPTAAPMPTTAAPEQPTVASDQPTAAPEQPTAAPMPTTPSPEQPTVASDQPTAEPKPTTPAPEQTPAAPYQPSAAPKPTDPATPVGVSPADTPATRPTASDGPEDDSAADQAPTADPSPDPRSPGATAPTPAERDASRPHTGDTHPDRAHAYGPHTTPADVGADASPAAQSRAEDDRGGSPEGDTHPDRAHASGPHPAASGGRPEADHLHKDPAPAPGSGDPDARQPSGPAPDPGHSHHHRDRPLAHSADGKGPAPQRPEPRGGLLMGRPFGVPVYVAPSWFLVAALITWVFGGQLERVLPELGAARYLVSLFFAVAFYASVLVHELAHTVAALRFKLPVRRIQLQFFGGVSEIEKEAETPGREFVLAFVGPLLSLVLAGVFYAALLAVEPGTVPGVLLAGLMISNLIVAAFNLLPGLPLDGGRMLRAVVWKITGKPMTGTIAAAWVGRALAVSVLIGLPLLTQSGALGTDAVDNVGMDTVLDALLAAILAAIIWTGAGNSLRMARLREHLPELRARALTRRAVPVETDTPLSEALRRANAAGARALVVVDADGQPLSLVREAAIVGVPEHRRPWVAVSGLAQDLTDGMRVSAELSGEELLDALRATPATEYLVVEETGEIYGVLSAADVERAFVKAMARPS